MTRSINQQAVSAIIGATLFLGCATPPPPRHLLDARAAYQKARSGKASELTPAELHTAKVALSEAETAYQDEPESAEANTLAYVALRQSQIVESQANAKNALNDLKRTEAELADLQEREIRRTHDELAKAKELLSVRGEQLANASEKLASTNAQLEEEKIARAAAEKRERDAMMKLAAAAAINVKEEARGTVIILPGNVLFGSGKFALTPGAQRKLMLVAGTLAPQSETHNIVVEGHTDSRGRREFNMELSYNRARAVMQFLVNNGVLAESTSAQGLGPDRPLATNNTRDGRAQNRRVEIIVKPVEPK